MDRTVQTNAELNRQDVWTRLRNVAKPDSRFHWDFSSYICDFDGSDICAHLLAGLDAWKDASTIFVTPDNSTQAVRRRALQEGRSFVMTTYGIRRGFTFVDADSIPARDQKYASTLDGIEEYARQATLADLRTLEPLSLLVTGASVVSRNGVRLGKGHGYFDLEWAILSEIGVLSEVPVIANVCHDCQVVDEMSPSPHDALVDVIVTPTQVIRVHDNGRLPGRVRWEMLAPDAISEIPPLAELHATIETTGSTDQMSSGSTEQMSS